MDEKKQRAYEESDIHLDSPEYLVVEPKSAFAANYFLSTDKFNSEQIRSLLRHYRYFIFIDKNSEKSWTIVIPDDKSDMVFTKETQPGQFVGTDEDSFFENFEKISSFIEDLIGGYGTYKELLSIKNGNSKETINDDIIYKVKLSKSNPGKSMVILRFNNNEYLSLFEYDGEVSEDFVKNMFSTYGSNWEFRDYYSMRDEWNEGYVMSSFNQENLDLVHKICRYVSPEIKRSDLNNMESLSKVSELFLELFERKVDSIVSSYYNTLEQCYYDSSVDEITSDLCDILEKYHIYKKSKSCFYEYVTSINNLISLYSKSKNKGKSLHSLLKSLLSMDNISFNYENTMYGECHNQHFDDKGFQLSVGNDLESILEKLEDDEDLPFKDLKVYNEIVDKISSKFGFKKWIKLPKDENQQIKFIKVNPEDNIIEYELHTKDDKFLSGKGDMEQINLLLYHPELNFGD